MNIGEKAFKELFPEKQPRKIDVKYSKAFNPYNANIKYNYKKITFSLSHLWQDVGEEIKIGLMQHLLLRVWKEKKSTLNIELYEKFSEKLPNYAFAPESEEPELNQSFSRVNQAYFNDYMDKPGLEWGSESKTQLGLYTYNTDTVRISTIFKDLDDDEQWLLDYVMYHELLHKKFGLKHKDGNCRHHPPEFKAKEREFKVDCAEKKLSSFVAKARMPQPLVRRMRNIFK
ncbi:SprT-like domain-containing protein [Nanoarchaeota archaeon]